MADKADDIQHEIIKGRQEIEVTRSAITEKLAILEERVEETVETVKHTFDLHYQMKQRPWLLLSGSLLVGYTLGRRGCRSSTTAGLSGRRSHSQPYQSTLSEVKGDLAAIKGAAFGAVLSTLWAMAKQVLLPTARQIDGALTKPGAQPNDSPETTNRVVTSKTNGRSEV